jgi:hypothetical protein
LMTDQTIPLGWFGRSWRMALLPSNDQREAAVKRFLFLLVGLLCVAVGVSAQADDTTWQALTSGVVSFRVPPTWVTDATLGSIVAEDPTSGATLTLTVILVGADATLDGVVTEALTKPTLPEVVSNNPIDLPAGAARRVELTGTINDEALRVVQYFVRVDEALITLTGAAQADNNTAVSIFRQAANTLELAGSATGWTLFSDNTRRLSLRAPADWEQIQTGNNVLTIVQRPTSTIVTLNYRPILITLTLEEATQYLLTIYQEQGIQVAGFEAVILPTGEAYRLLLENVPAQNADGNGIFTTQLQYVILRGDVLILVNAGSETSQFSLQRPLLEQMIDTMTYLPS